MTLDQLTGIANLTQRWCKIPSAGHRLVAMHHFRCALREFWIERAYEVDRSIGESYRTEADDIFTTWCYHRLGYMPRIVNDALTFNHPDHAAMFFQRWSDTPLD